jgi:CRP-like cAMP-binding protein
MAANSIKTHRVVQVTANQPAKTIADLFDGLPYRHFPAKQMIFYQGDIIARVYYIISGYVRLYNITSKGNERTLMILGPGESLPLIQTEHAQYYYSALTDVETAYGTYEEIVDRFLADKGYMESVREAGVKLMIRMMKQMEIISSDTAAERVKKIIEHLGKFYGEPSGDYQRINFKLTHQEVANLVNVTRETASQSIVKLERSKFIKIDNDGHYLVKSAVTKLLAK